MVLKQCFLTRNDCYTEARTMRPVGIVVHSTGCNQKLLRRFVQPTPGSANYDSVIADLGKNPNGNSWNRPGVDKCVHAMIGLNKTGDVETYQTLPFNCCAWGVASGDKGSYNCPPTPYIQFEILEDGLKDEAYFNKVFREAIEFCASLCVQFGLTESCIVSHWESYLRGYGSRHVDCDHWLARFGKSMNWFREEVKKELSKYYVQVGPFNSVTEATVVVSAFKNAKVIETEGTEPKVVTKDDVGKLCKIADGATSYGKTTTFASWVYDGNIRLYIREVEGDRVVFSTLKTGAVTGSTHIKNVRLA